MVRNKIGEYTVYNLPEVAKIVGFSQQNIRERLNGKKQQAKDTILLNDREFYVCYVGDSTPLFYCKSSVVSY